MSESIDDIVETPDPYHRVTLFEIGRVYDMGGPNVLGVTFPLSGKIKISEEVPPQDRNEILEHEVNHLEHDRAWYNKLDERDVRQMTKNDRERRGIVSTYHNNSFRSSAHIY